MEPSDIKSMDFDELRAELAALGSAITTSALPTSSCLKQVASKDITSILSNPQRLTFSLILESLYSDKSRALTVPAPASQ